MTQTQVLASKCVFSVFLLYLTSTRVSAQVMTSACGSESTIVIKFPENDLNVTLPLSDEYVQNVLTNGEPTRVDVNFDPGDKITAKYPFSDYFLTSYNTVQKAFQVRMIKGIDRDGATGTTEDDVNILQYQLVCFPDAAAVSFYSAQYRVLKIQILDVNDNTPQFVYAPYSYTVNELTPVGLTVFRGISATDLDEGPNKQIFYSFSSGPSPLNLNGTQYFILPSELEGIVGVLSPLDFESMYAAAQGDASQVYYNIIVTARDSASPQSAQRTSQTTLKITITDGDDQGPEFIYPSCIRSSRPTSKSCIRPKYLTSVTSGNASISRRGY
ncbi:protocadherin-like wing polarity protein stan isoform X1 [Biomphalaria pfeifferi]|uniref:Protocadherin-like wing polarity protein stan isoform X1 n=1 Tax=Biomphalaria pfeifferi TaxID=112525 RepID=A0AAD8B183_BIOPF|nr:protocadherin-like wing polarity protein stan isoform X1 [Biomphalaria pfeifferi]